MLALLVLLGCPRAFGPGGTFDRALKKDQKARLEPSRLREKAGPECPPDNELELLCEYPEDDICPKECLE
jgi:hypothetical protein